MPIDVFASILTALGEFIHLVSDDVTQEITGSFFCYPQELKALCDYGLATQTRTVTAADGTIHPVYQLTPAGAQLAARLIIVVSDQLLTSKFLVL